MAMKRLTYIFFLVLFVQNLYAQYDSIKVDNRWRTFLVHLPPSYESTPEDTLFSVILALHGGFGSAYSMQHQSQLSQKADTAAQPFIVVYPEGVKSPDGVRTWNAGDCCGYAQEENIDDVAFISALIDTLLQRYRIESQRVYVTGMSNGGMMSYRLAEELTFKIAAIAPVAATMVLEGPWQPTRPMPIIHFHSYLDENIPYYGGVGNGFSDHYNPPVDSVLNVWAELNGCVLRNDTLFHEEGEYLFKVWSQCNNNADIHCYVTYDGGHSWPGGEKPTPFSDPPSEKINADDLMWAFFLGHPADNNTSTVKNNNRLSPGALLLLHNYPNPFNARTFISYQLGKACFVRLNIFNLHGQHIQSLVRQKQNAGSYRYSFEAQSLPSGIYFYELKTDGRRWVRKMILLK